MLYGHHNDTVAYAKGLVEFDSRLPEILDSLKEEDILFITADHGCDPTTESTDHSREYTPLLIYGSSIKAGANIHTRKSFSDIASTIKEYLNIDADIEGESFLNLILK